MNIIISGCGKVGTFLAEYLCQEGHDITIIDTKAEIVQHVTKIADVRGLVGNGASYNLLKEAGIDSANLMIAVTNADELNLLCCLIAKNAGGCHTMARVRNPIYHEEIDHIKRELGLSRAINPERAVAREAARLLRFPSAMDIDTFARGRVEMLHFHLSPDSPLCYKLTREIPEFSKHQILLGLIQRKNETIIATGNTQLLPNDNLTIIGSQVNASHFFHSIGFKTNQVKTTIIVGGGKTSYYLANELLAMGIQVKIIERDKKHCEELCEMLPKATIIWGDGSDQELLKEEGLEQAEGFAALTGIDEENIMLSLYAKQNSNAKLITKVNNTAFDSIIDTLDIGSVLHPKLITAERIIRYVRGMQNSLESNIETLHHLVNGKAEALEFIIQSNLPGITNIPIQNLKLRKNLLICAIHRNGKIVIPTGQDEIKPLDSVILITTDCGIMKDIADILEK
ncbi:MAG: Trk system potassium transporter TrkA [Lachnospiraceae bacterium]|nr:Trk system potassium transporter TrkA [Lachnospiraceae bacterium]